ncbi:MAG: hypothetical protein AAGA85_08975 [Bacteroidota bacterium]
MKIQLSKAAPTAKDLLDRLKKRFSNQYAVEASGWSQERIVIKESYLVGAEVSIREQEISIESARASKFERIATGLGYLTAFILFFIPFMVRESQTAQSRPKYKALELEIGNFLKQEFN